MDREKLACVLKEMQKFHKEIETKLENTHSEQEALKHKSSWLQHKHEIDFLVTYYCLLVAESERQINKFLDIVMREEYRENLLSQKELPKVSEVKEDVSILEQQSSMTYVLKKKEEITCITFNCIFCYTDILISKQAEHLADCSEADEIYHKTASKPAELVCGKCGRKDFKNARGFSKHVNSCEGGVTVCSNCKNDFKTERGLIKHKPKCKGKDIERYQCQKCDKWIPVSNKKSHQRYHIREEKKKT